MKARTLSLAVFLLFVTLFPSAMGDQILQAQRLGKVFLQEKEEQAAKDFDWNFFGLFDSSENEKERIPRIKFVPWDGENSDDDGEAEEEQFFYAKDVIRQADKENQKNAVGEKKLYAQNNEKKVESRGVLGIISDWFHGSSSEETQNLQEKHSLKGDGEDGEGMPPKGDGEGMPPKGDGEDDGSLFGDIADGVSDGVTGTVGVVGDGVSGGADLVGDAAEGTVDIAGDGMGAVGDGVEGTVDGVGDGVDALGGDGENDGVISNDGEDVGVNEDFFIEENSDKADKSLLETNKVPEIQQQGNRKARHFNDFQKEMTKKIRKK